VCVGGGGGVVGALIEKGILPFEPLQQLLVMGLSTRMEAGKAKYVRVINLRDQKLSEKRRYIIQDDQQYLSS